MKKQISPKDYDTYKISIPLKKIYPKQVKKYIFSELEKMHPCFSEKDAVDCKFSFGKKGVQANVTVLEALTLAGYKKSYPKAILCTNEGRKVFLDNKQKKISIITALCVFLIFCSSLYLSFSKNKLLNNEELQFSESKVLPKNSSNIPIKVGLGKCMEKIRKSGGKIESLDWVLNLQNEKMNETVKAEINGGNSLCLYEDLPAMGNEKEYVSNVIYQDGKERFSYKYENKLTENFIPSFTSFPVEERKAFIQEIKKYFAGRNIILEKEEFFSNDYLYRLTFESDNLDFLNENNNEIIFSANEYFLSQCAIHKGSVKWYKCTLSFSDCYIPEFENKVSDLVYKNSDLFMHKEEILFAPVKNKPTENETGNENLRKIGVITHENSDKKYFYKNEKGKIVHNEF